MRKYEPVAAPVLEYDPGASLKVPDSCSLAGDAAGAGAGVATGRVAWCFFAGLCRSCDFFFATHRFRQALAPPCTMGPATEPTAAVTTATAHRSNAPLIRPPPH